MPSWLDYPAAGEINNGRNEQEGAIVAGAASSSSTASTSSTRSNLPIVPMEGGNRDGQKYYCLRTMGQQTDCLNSGVLDCSVTFSVDKNICVIGVQVPTQVPYEVSLFIIFKIIFLSLFLNHFWFFKLIFRLVLQRDLVGLLMDHTLRSCMLIYLTQMARD